MTHRGIPGVTFTLVLSPLPHLVNGKPTVCFVDLDGRKVTINGAVIVSKGAGVVRQDHPKSKGSVKTYTVDETTAAMVTGTYVDPRAGRETVQQYAERWRATQDHRLGTAALYERVLRLHEYPVLGELPLRSVRQATRGRS